MTTRTAPEHGATPGTDRLLTSAEVAAQLGVSPATVRSWRREGIGPAYAVVSPGCVRYKQSAIDRHVQQTTVRPAGATA